MSKLAKIIIFTILLFSFLEKSLASQKCQKIASVCVEGAKTKIIEGVEIYKPCWKYDVKYRCYGEIQDYCKTIESVSSCEKISSKCSDKDQYDKKCNQIDVLYKCADLLQHSNEVVDLGKNYTLTTSDSTYNECSDKNKKENCDKISSICIEGEETRVVNGKKIHKDCWKYQENYSCKTNIQIDNCTNIDKNCTLQKSQCLSSINDVCNHRQNTYYCSSSELVKTNDLLCADNVYCANGACEEDKEEKDSGFAKSISYLSAVNEVAQDQSQNSGQVRIFTGKNNSCEKSFAGYNNCCKDQGWGQDSLGASCTGEEKKLMAMQSKRLCHYVGQYCAKKLPLIGKCQKTRKVFCCFNSKISRVVMEQGRAQLGVGWGNPEAPNCTGFTTEELQSLRFDEMDLQEISDDVMDNVSAPNKPYIQDKINTTILNYE